MMLKTLCIIFLLGVISAREVYVGNVKATNHPIYFRTQVVFGAFFYQDSNFTAAFLTCNNVKGLAAAIQSFAIYNTKRIHKIIVYEMCKQYNLEDQPLYLEAIPADYSYKKNEDNEKLLPHVQVYMNKTKEIDAVKLIISRVKTQYVLLVDDKWNTLGPFGFIEKGIELLIQKNRNKEVVSGVTMSPTFTLANPKMTERNNQYFTANLEEKTGSGWSGIPILLSVSTYKKQLLPEIQSLDSSDICPTGKLNCLSVYLTVKGIPTLALGGHQPSKMILQTGIHYKTKYDDIANKIHEKFEYLKRQGVAQPFFIAGVLLCLAVEGIICFLKKKIEKDKKYEQLQQSSSEK